MLTLTYLTLGQICFLVHLNRGCCFVVIFFIFFLGGGVRGLSCFY